MEKSAKQLDRLFITGTDTGVGKTVLSLLLMDYFYSKGKEPFYIKPVQTGCTDPYSQDSDSRFIYEHIGALRGKDAARSVIYCFTNPKAPYFAARDEGRKIDLSVIAQFVDEKSSSHSPLIIEGAGGLFVPVCEGILMVDLVGMLGAKPILAARAGLGTINHTLLSLESLYRRGIEPAGVVFLDGGKTATPPDMIEENMEAVERVSGLKVCGVIGYVEDFSNLSKKSRQVFDNLFSF